MKILELNKPVNIPFIVRQNPLAGDLINITLRNEHTNLIINKSTNWYYNEGRLILSFETDLDFKVANKYQITLKNGANIIYIGNLLIVKENTNLQNYTPSSQITQRFKSKVV